MQRIKISHKAIFVTLLFSIFGNAMAGSISEVVPIGEGKYMLTGRNTTIFGSADGITVKLMTKANEFCQAKNKSEAVLLDVSGESAQYGNNTASSTVYFRCNKNISATETKMKGRFYQSLNNGKIEMQITLATTEDCQSLLEAGSNNNNQCSSESASDRLPVRAILESPNDNELIKVEASTQGLCDGLVSGLASSGGLSVVKACSNK